MTYTTNELLSFTKKRVLEIARELKIQGRTKMNHHDLIDKIVEVTKPEVTSETTSETIPEVTSETSEAIPESTSEMTPETSEAIPESTSEMTPETSEVIPESTSEPETVIEVTSKTNFEFNVIPTPEEFFNQVIVLNDKLEINRICNALLDSLSEKYTVATISKKLAEYKKLFYNYQHENSKFNETVETKKGVSVQHIAARLLRLSEEQQQILGEERQKNSNARNGFNEDGDFRNVEKSPIDIEKIVKKSCELLTSNDPHTIACGILNLTGLRANEQNMPAREYPEWGLIERNMIVVDEFVIGFKGISKKSSFEDANAYHTRATLAPAQLIVDAHERYLSSKAAQSIPTNYEKYRKGFQDTFGNRFGELFGLELSTIEAFDDDGNLLKANGSPHKARAFYACAVRAIVKAKGLKNSGSTTYLQLCLAHETPAVTIKYLGRYDESEFINPIDINIPTNIKELGKMTITTIEKAKDVPTPSTKAKTTSKTDFDLNTFIDALDGDLQVKFQQSLDSGMSLTNAVISVINAAKQQSSETRTVKKTAVSNEVSEIVEAIMTYNMRQELNTNCVVPAYSLINKISERLLDKTIAKVTIDNWISSNTERLDKQLVNFEIPGGLYNSGWNGKHHRKTMDVVIESVITIFNER